MRRAFPLARPPGKRPVSTAHPALQVPSRRNRLAALWGRSASRTGPAEKCGPHLADFREEACSNSTKRPIRKMELAREPANSDEKRSPAEFAEGKKTSAERKRDLQDEDMQLVYQPLVDIRERISETCARFQKVFSLQELFRSEGRSRT